MKITNIYYHPQFRKSFSNLPKDIQKKAEEKSKIFKENPFSPSLDTHKLHGKLKNQWSFSVSRFWLNSTNLLFPKFPLSEWG